MNHIHLKDTSQPESIGGHTHIDRYPELMKNIAYVCDYLRGKNGRPVKILFAPCSVGYEPLSFARELHMREKLHEDFVQIHALDKNANFIKCAKEFAVPIPALDSRRLREWLTYLDFSQESLNTATFTPEITQHIQFEEPQDLCAHESSYDVHAMMNFLYHIDDE